MCVNLHQVYCSRTSSTTNTEKLKHTIKYYYYNNKVIYLTSKMKISDGDSWTVNNECLLRSYFFMCIYFITTTVKLSPKHRIKVDNIVIFNSPFKEL